MHTSIMRAHSLPGMLANADDRGNSTQSATTKVLGFLGPASCCFRSQALSGWLLNTHVCRCV